MRLGIQQRLAGHRRLGLTFCDQAVSSGSNFIVGVAIARFSGPVDFGAYMLVYTLVWLLLVGCHRSLVTEPIIVTSRDGEDNTADVAHGVSADLLLGTAVSIVTALAGLVAVAFHSRFGTPLLAMSPWFPALLVQDYWRAMAFQRRRPGLALLNDSVFAFVQVALILAFWLLGWRSVGYMISAWGIGAAAGALLGLVAFPASARPRSGQKLMQRLWPVSRWMLADNLTGFASGQAYVVFVAGLLSGFDYGGFTAASNLTGPVTVILLAGGNIGLPAASSRADPENRVELRRFTRRLSLGAFLFIGAYGAAIAVAGGRVLSLLYGKEFARFAPIATLSALGYVVMSMVFGQGIALKAAGRMRRLWRAQAVVGAASLTSVFVLVRLLGTPGAGWASLATGIYYAAAVQYLYVIELVRPEQRLTPSSGA